jgi:glutamine amidotransferase
MSSVAIIDYGLGNVRSVANAILSQGADPYLTKDHQEILNADGLILPGVGAFPHGMSQLNKYGLTKIIDLYVSTGKPLLGICLGMQMLLSKGEEFQLTNGLGLIEGVVTSMASNKYLTGRLPHVGWSKLSLPMVDHWDRTILDKIKNFEEMYFVHSYMAVPTEQKHILATTQYQGIEFCSVIKKDNIYGCQFHPEKSGPEGLKIISNFIKITEGEFSSE